MKLVSLGIVVRAAWILLPKSLHYFSNEWRARTGFCAPAIVIIITHSLRIHPVIGRHGRQWCMGTSVPVDRTNLLRPVGELIPQKGDRKGGESLDPSLIQPCTVQLYEK